MGHEVTNRECRYSTTLSLTSALDGMGDQRHARPFYPRERNSVPIAEEAGWVPMSVWTGAESIASNGIRSPGRPASSESQYWLSSSGPTAHRDLFWSVRPEDVIFVTAYRRKLYYHWHLGYKSTYKFEVENPHWNRTLGRPMRRWESDFKIFIG